MQPDETSREATETGAYHVQRIARQVVRGSFYNIAASFYTLLLGFTRSVLLARLLLPEDFGIVALVLFYQWLISQIFTGWISDQSLLHRQELDVNFMGTYFTLRAGTGILTVLAVVFMAPILGSLYVSMQSFSLIMVALAFVSFGQILSYMQETLLSKQLAFARLVHIDVFGSTVMTVVAPLCAWFGFGAWALVAEQASGIIARLCLSWGPYRVWRPHASWQFSNARWLWNFGRPLWVAGGFQLGLDRFDDFWIGTTLGNAALGYYTRAFEFARYPRRVVANPLLNVLTPTFARLQGDRHRLSQAFYRGEHLLIRGGFYLSALFALVVPEFVVVVIGTRWTPMILTFRFMLVYALLDVILLLAGGLLIATGRTRDIQRMTVAQIFFFIPAVIVTSQLWGVNGVALAADAMLFVGGWLLLGATRKVVDFSLSQLMLTPLIALILGFSAGIWLELNTDLTPWLSALTKSAIFSMVYIGCLGLIEREDYLRGVRWLAKTADIGQTD